MSHRRNHYHHHPSSSSASVSSESSNRVLLVLVVAASLGYLLYHNLFKPLWQAHLDRMARKTGADLLKNDPKQAQTSQSHQQQQQQQQQQQSSQANGHDANQAGKEAAAPLHRPPKSSNKTKKSRSKDNKEPPPPPTESATAPDGPEAASSAAAKENVAPAPTKKQRYWGMSKAHKSAKGKGSSTTKSTQDHSDAPSSGLGTSSVGIQAVPEASHSAIQAHARSRSSSLSQQHQLQQIEALSRDAAQGLARLNTSTQHSLAGPSHALSPNPTAPHVQRHQLQQKQQQDEMYEPAPPAAPKGHRHQTSTASSYNGPPTAKILAQTLLSKQQNGDHKDGISPTNSVLSQPDSKLFSPQSTSTNLSSTATAPSLHLSSSSSQEVVSSDPVASTLTDETRQPLSNSSTIRKGKSPHAKRRHQPQSQQQQQQSWVPGLPQGSSAASSSSSSDQGQDGDPTPQQSSSSSASQREEDDGSYWRQKPRDDASDVPHDRTLRGRDFEAASSSSIRPARSSSSSVSAADSERSASRPRSDFYSSSSEVQLPHRFPSPTTLLPGARIQKTAFAAHNEAAQAAAAAAAQESAIDSPALPPAHDTSRPRRASYQFPGSNQHQHHQQQGRASRSARNSFSQNGGPNMSIAFGNSTRAASNGYQHQQPPQSASMTYQNWLQQQMQFQQQQHMFATQQQQHPAYQMLQAQITQQVKNLQAQCQANIMSQAQALAASTSGATTPDPVSVPAISQAPQMSQSASFGGSPAHAQQFNRKAPPPALLLPTGTSQQAMPNGLTSSQPLSNPELASSIGSHQSVSPLVQSTTYNRSMAQQQQALRASQSQFLSEPSPLPSRPASRAHSISSATSSHHQGGHASTIDVSQQPALPNATLGLSTSSSSLHHQQQQQTDPDKYALLERLSALEDKVLAAQVENERKNKELEIASWRLHCAEAERAADDRHKLETIRKLEDRLRASEQSGLASSADEEAKAGAADSRHRSDSLSAASEASFSGAHPGASPYHKPSGLPPRLDMTNVPSNSATPFQYYSSPTSAQSVYPPADMFYQTGGMLPAPNFNGPYQRYRNNHNSQYRRKGKKSAANAAQRSGSNPSYSQASSPRMPHPRQASQSGDSAAGRTDEGESGDADEDDLVIMLRPDGSASKHILADQNLNAGLLGLGYDVESHYASAEDEDPTGPEPGEEWIGSIPSAYTKKSKEDASQDTTLTPNDKEPESQPDRSQSA